MDKGGFGERRTRVMFYLPIKDGREVKAVNHIICYLQELRTSRLGLSGFTHSILRDPVFRGYWWSGERLQWIKDRIVFFIVDYHFDIHDPALTEHLMGLKNTISEAYRIYGSIQEEIWLVSHSIVRYVS